MNKIPYLIKLFPLVLYLLLSSSCATILGGKNNTLHFNAENLQEAEIYIDGKKIGDAPGKIKVSKGEIQHGSKIEIKANGFQTQEYIVIRKIHAAYALASLLSGGIPLLVDYSTGNIYRPRPNKFQYELVKQNEPK